MALPIPHRQSLYARVEGDKNAASFHRLPEEQSVRPLLVTSHFRGHEFEPVRRLVIQRPEIMSGMAGGFA